MKLVVEDRGIDRGMDAPFRFKVRKWGLFHPWIWGFGDTREEAIRNFKVKYNERYSKPTKTTIKWNPKEDI